MVVVNVEGLKCTFYFITCLWSWRRCFINEGASSPVCCLSVCHWAQVFLVDEGPSEPHPGQLGLYFDVRPALIEEGKGLRCLP